VASFCSFDTSQTARVADCGRSLGHVSPEALAGGPVGKVRDGDEIEIIIDRVRLQASIDFVGENGERFDAEEGSRRLQRRGPRHDLAPDPDMPQDTRLWAAMVQASGGIWGGCVYDADAIADALKHHHGFTVVSGGDLVE